VKYPGVEHAAFVAEFWQNLGPTDVGLRYIKKYSVAAEIILFMSNLYLIRCGGRSDSSNASWQQGNFHHVQGELQLRFLHFMPRLVISCRRHCVFGLSMHACIRDHLLKAC